MAKLAYNFLTGFSTTYKFVWDYVNPAITFAGIPFFQLFSVPDHVETAELEKANSENLPDHAMKVLPDDETKLILGACDYEAGKAFIMKQMNAIKMLPSPSNYQQILYLGYEDVLKNLVLANYLGWNYFLEWLFRIATLIITREVENEPLEDILMFEEVCNPKSYGSNFIDRCIVAFGPMSLSNDSKLSISNLLAKMAAHHGMSIITEHPWPKLMMPNLITFLSQRTAQLDAPEQHFDVSASLQKWRDVMVFRRYSTFNRNTMVMASDDTEWGLLSSVNNNADIIVHYPQTFKSFLLTDMRYMAATEAQLRHIYRKSNNSQYDKDYPLSVFLTDKYYLIFTGRVRDPLAKSAAHVWSDIPDIVDHEFADETMGNRHDEEFKDLVSDLYMVARSQL